MKPFRSLFLCTAAVGLAYLALAWLGRLMALPPGYASPVWPAAGLALAALLAGGLRLWLGIWLGAFAADLLLGASGAGALVAAISASGSTLQALLGAYLTRPLLARQDPFASEGEAWRFVLLAGPFACVVSATLGITALYGLGRLSGDQFFSQWLAWWTGNTLGVLLFAPIVLTAWPGLRPAWARDGVRIVAPLLVTAALAAGAHLWLDQSEQAEARLEIKSRMDNVADIASVEWADLFDGLWSVERLFASGPAVTQPELTEFTARLIKHLGLMGVAWLPRVRADERATFEAAAAAELGQPYRIVEPAAGDALQPAATRSEYFPVRLGASRLPGTPLYGLDQAAYPMRRAAMERARDTGEATGMRMERLLRTSRPGFLFFVPVYAPGFDAAQATVEARRAALRGFVLGLADREEMLAPLAKKAQAAGLRYRVSGVTPGEPVQVYADTLGSLSPAFSREVNVGGRLWRIEMSPEKGWQDGSSPMQRGLMGLLVVLALLVAFAVLSTAGRAAARRRHEETLEAQVAARTQALEAANRELAGQQAELSALLDHLTDAVIRIDSRGIIHYANPAVEPLLGYTPTELLGHNVSRLTPQPHAAAHDGYIARYLATGEAHVIGRGREVEAQRKDGTRLPMWLTITEYTVGNERYFLGQLHDLTEDKRIHAGIEGARRAAETANRAKSDFLATMSHEIRTPMNGVIGLIEILRRSSLRPSQMELVDTLAEAAEALLGLIDDLLDFSKIEAGKLELEARPFFLEREVETVCATFDAAARDKGVELIPFVDPGLSHPVVGDAKRLRQVLLNLTSNAIKFSVGRNRALVHVRAEAVESGLARVRFTVTDTGIGMAPETVANLFQPFTQAESGTARRFGGSGLGLSISQRLVTLMGGRIEVESAPDVGTRMSFVLSFPLAETPPAAARPQANLSGLSVRVVSSDGEFARDLCTWLDAAGARAWVGARGGANPDGEDAVPPRTIPYDIPGGSPSPATVDSDAVPPVDVLLLDVVDEQVDAEKLSVQRAAAGDKTPVVLLGRGQRRRPRIIAPDVVAVDANCLRRRALLDAVAVAAGRASPEFDEELPSTDEEALPSAAPSIAHAGTSGTLILAAEDNEINRKVILRQLALLGYAAEIAGNGREALERWRQAPQRYGLLLTDLHMPELDGYALTAAIRAEEKGHLPIVALSANAMSGEAQRCLDAGMEGLLVKPVTLKHLEETLRLWLPKAARAGGSPSPVTVTGGSRSAVTANPDGGDAVPPETPLDIAALTALVGDDRTVIDELLRDFQHSLRRAAAEMATAFSQRDNVALGALAGGGTPLQLHYQPQVDLASGRLRGAEALARWHDPDLGPVSPAEFVPVAEERGLAGALGEWALAEACRQMQAWQQAGLRLPELLAVNVSARQFADPDFAGRVQAIVATAGLAPERFELELTETALAADAQAAVAILQTLAQAGFRLAIDDFGVGYSSLSYLTHFRLYKLKIDLSFVRDMLGDHRAHEIVATIIGMAANLGLKTLAEGVETEAQASELRRMGCDDAQGYYFGRPEPADVFAQKWLHSSAPE